MCGIVGISGSVGVESGRIRAGLDVLEHRGPDGSGIWLSPEADVGLGHTRLSVIGLKNGEQPLVSMSGDLAAVVNGEIYDYKRMRKVLQERGYCFRTGSDSELVLALYETQGLQCLEKLRGEFAFIIYDRRKAQIIAGRDRFGIKPLYYAMSNGALYVASEIKALSAMGVALNWDPVAVYDFEYGVLHDDRTLFKAVKQVPPGAVLLSQDGHIRVHQYWDWEFSKKDERSDRVSKSEYIDTFRELFKESVSQRLVADVPVGCCLSGGLDSCSVLGVASELSESPIDAYTIAFEDEDYDETDIAARTARHVNARFNVLDVTHDDMAHNFDQAVWNCETLFINPHAIAKFMLSKFISSHGTKVVLTGEGADEVLGGYAIFRQDLLNTKYNEAERQALLDQLMASNTTSIGLLLSEDADESGFEQVKAQLGYVPSQFLGGRKRFKLYSSFHSEAFANSVGKRDVLGAYLNDKVLVSALNNTECFNKSLYLWSKTSFPNYMLSALGDRAEMAHSVEGRPPILDHHLVEFCNKLPISMKVNGLTEKYILREACKSYLLPEVYERQKNPFMAPSVSRDDSGALSEFILDTLSSDVAKSVPFYDNDKLLNLAANLPNLPENVKAAADSLLIQVASLYSMHRQFRVSF